MEILSLYFKNKNQDIFIMTDISYKYMPISIFDVQKMGKKDIRGK